MKKILISALALVLAAQSTLSLAATPTATPAIVRDPLGLRQQEAYKKQVDRLFRWFEARLDSMTRTDALTTLRTIDAKLDAILKKRLSAKNRFVYSYANTLVDKKLAKAPSTQPTGNVPAWTSGGYATPPAAVDTSDPVIAATVTADTGDSKGQTLTPFREEEIGRFVVTARGDVETLTDVYLSNVGTANLSERAQYVRLYLSDGTQLAKGNFEANGNTLRFQTSYAIPKNVAVTIVAKALLNDAGDPSAFGKTVRLQLGALPGVSVVEGTSNGIRLVSRFTGQAVPVHLSGGSAGATHALMRTSPGVALAPAATLSTNSFVVGFWGGNFVRLGKVYVDLRVPTGLTVDGWTLYKEREAPGNELASGTGPVPIGSGTNPSPIVLSSPLDVSAGANTLFVLAIRTSGSAPADGKRIFRVTDLEYWDFPASGGSVLISNLNQYAGTGLPTAEQEYGY